MVPTVLPHCHLSPAPAPWTSWCGCTPWRPDALRRSKPLHDPLHASASLQTSASASLHADISSHLHSQIDHAYGHPPHDQVTNAGWRGGGETARGSHRPRSRLPEPWIVAKPPRQPWFTMKAKKRQLVWGPPYWGIQLPLYLGKKRCIFGDHKKEGILGRC